MNFYENIFILAPNLDENAIENAVERVKNIVIKNGGEIIKTENWGRKKLAYNLKKQDKGFYMFLVFKSPPMVLSELERFFKVFDPLLKYMFIKMRKKQIEAVMASLKESESKPSDDSAPKENAEQTEQQKG
jgi:small subunit ribosomal protein S6